MCQSFETIHKKCKISNFLAHISGLNKSKWNNMGMSRIMSSTFSMLIEMHKLFNSTEIPEIICCI